MTNYTDERFNGRDTVTMTVYAKGEPMHFESPFRNLAEVHDVLMSRSNPFSAALAKAIDSENPRKPTDNQIGWAHKLAVDNITPKSEVQS